MPDSAATPSALPADDPNRKLTVANPDSPSMEHISVAGDTYTVLLTGEETGGRYCLIDMHVTPGGGPPPHRHDFEEMFTVLDGEIELTFRGEANRATAGSTVNVPPTRPTLSGTCRGSRHGCSACARHPVKRSSSGGSATRSTAVPPLPRSSARKNRPSAGNGRRRSRPSTDRSCSSPEPPCRRLTDNCRGAGWSLGHCAGRHPSPTDTAITDQASSASLRPHGPFAIQLRHGGRRNRPSPRPSASSSSSWACNYSSARPTTSA